MKIAGIRMTDPWASRVLRGKSVHTEQITGVPVETQVMMERVTFEHHGSEKNYRPLLHLTGELQGIRPFEALPYGIDEVTFRSGTGPTVDAFYEFDDAQLTELVSKGYFTEGFDPPENMAGILWDLPTTIDALILAPEHEEDTPAVFVTVHGQTELALDAENSGYVLAGYFENKLTSEAAKERQTQSSVEGVPTRSDEREDLFADVDFEEPTAGFGDEWTSRGQRGDGENPVVRSSIFEDLMAEFQENLPVTDGAELAEDVPEETGGPDILESIYNERIAPGVERALMMPFADGDTVPPETLDDVTTTPASDTAVEGSLTDLYEKEEELDVVPMAITPESEPVWEPETSAQADSGEAQPKPDQRTRRVQRALAHERATIELENSEADSEPGLA